MKYNLSNEQFDMTYKYKIILSYDKQFAQKTKHDLYYIIMKIQTLNRCSSKLNNSMFMFILYIIITLIKAQQGSNIQYSRSNLQSNGTCTMQYQNNSTMMNLGTCEELIYYMTVGIGTPPQYFNLQVSTGSNIVWVPITDINIFGFNQSESITYTNSSQPGEIIFPSGEVSGIYGTDYITFVNTTINSSSLILFVDRVSNVVFPPGIVGVIGMGYASALTQPNFLDTAYASQLIQSNTFTLFLGYGNQSFIMFNQLPETLISNSLFSNVVGGGYWTLDLLGLITGDVDMTTFAAPIAEIDSGNSLLQFNLPLAQMFNLTYLQDPSCSNFKGLTECSCTIMPTLPNMTFIFEGVSVQITPQQYVIQDSDTCYINIIVIYSSPYRIVIGAPLFSLYNITFSKLNNNIGFEGNTQQVIQFGTTDFYLSQFIMTLILIVIMLFNLGVLVFMLCINRETLLKTRIIYQTKTIRQRITQDIAPLMVRSYSYD